MRIKVHTYDTIPEDSLHQGCSGRRGVGGWGGVLDMKWNKRKKGWFFWNKPNLEQKPEALPEQENKCLDANLNGFKGGIRQQTRFFFWAAFGGYFQHSQSDPYSGSDYHQRSVHKFPYSTFLSHCCIASTAKLHNWIRSLYFWQYWQWCCIQHFWFHYLAGRQLNLHYPLFYRWYLTRMPFANWKFVLLIHYTRCIALDTFRVRKCKP